MRMPIHKPLAPNPPGFTIIELVVTLVIIGILAGVALPRFINLTADANVAVLESMGGAILSASNLVYAKALVEGVQSEPSATLDLDGDGTSDVQIQYGYPSGSRGNGVSQIMGGSFASEWTWSTNYQRTEFWLTTASLGGRSGQYINQTAVRNSGCYLLYYPAASAGESPRITYVTTDC